MTDRKNRAITFLQLAAHGETDQAFRAVSPNFRHHNPFFAAGANVLASAMKQNAEEHPHKTFEVLRALEDGDLVAVHSRIRMDPKASEIAVVHIFRFEGEQVAELWDVGQQVPADSPNENGAF